VAESDLQRLDRRKVLEEAENWIGILAWFRIVELLIC